METKKHFSKKEALVFGWQIYKKNVKFILLFFLIALFFEMAPGVLANSFRGQSEILATIIQILGWALNFVVSMGIIRASLKLCDGQKPQVSDLWTSYPLIFKYFLSYLLYSIIVVVGLLLLVIPGIIFAIKFMFYSYLVVDKQLGPVEAIRHSSLITQGEKVNLILFGLLLGIVNLAGVLLFVVGLLVTIPVSAIAMAYVYRRLSS